MTSQNDCWFFYNATCTKGDDCPFRHEPLAMGKPVCVLWNAGSCNRNPCRYRHSNVELVRSTAQCYYENQPTGCLNSSCQFTHSKLRPLLTNFSTPRLPSQPVLNVLLRSRFPPNSQMFGGNRFASVSMTSAPRQAMQTLLRNHPPPHPIRGLPPAVIPSNPFQMVRPNMFNQNHPSLGFTNPSSTTPRNLVKPLLRRPGETPISLPHPISRRNASTTQANPSLADLIRPSTGDGLLPLPATPVLPFSLGGLFARNIVSAAQVSNKQKTSSSAKASYKRTVKKYEGIRNRKINKQSKRRDDKKKPQDANVEKKKKKRGKNRKTKQGHSASKSKKSTGVDHSEAKTDATSVDVIDKNAEDEEDTYEEINLGFKVKTLEEILRDKALKKFLERQNNSSATMGSSSEDEITLRRRSGTSSSESIDVVVLNASMIDCIDEVPHNDETNQTKTSKPKAKKLKPLKPLKPLRNTKRSNLVENTTSNVEQNQCGDQTKLLPPLKRLKPLSKTVRKEYSTDKVLKRKLEASSDDPQAIPSKRRHKIETVMLDNASSSSEGNVVDTATKTAKESSSEGVETLNNQDISPMDVDKSQNKRKRTIIVLQSRPRYKPVKAKPTNVENVQELRNREKTKLAQLPEQNIFNEGETSQNIEDNNSKKSKIEQQTVVPKDLPPNGQRKPLGKVIKLTKDTKNAAQKKDFQLSVNSESSKAINNVPKRIESSARPGITATNNAEENVNKEVFNKKVNQVINPDADFKTSDNETTVQLSKKPTKMIKLNRNRLAEKNNDSRNYEGKPRIQFSSLGRIMKMNAKAVASKQAVVKPEFLKQENNSDMEMKNSKSTVKEEAELQHTDTSQSATAPVNLKDIPTCGETKSISNDKRGKTYKKQLEKAIMKPTCSTVTKLSHNLSHKEQAEECSAFAMVNPQNNEIQDQLAVQEELNKEENQITPVTKLKKASPRPNIEGTDVLSRKILRKEKDLETHKLEKISPEEQPQDSLDRLFEEVSEDVEDEGEDFLNEALEKAIAELSPVNTDDEEDVSNADDLLLEIEEMIT